MNAISTVVVSSEPLLICLAYSIVIINCQSKYFKGSTPLDWPNAKAYCNSYGTRLASIHSASEFHEAAQLCDISSNSACWIGLNDIKEEGVYEWEDGSITDYGFNDDDNTNPTSGIYPWGYWNGQAEPGNKNGDQHAVGKQTNFYGISKDVDQTNDVESWR